MDVRKQSLVLPQNATIREALQAINELPLGIVALVDEHSRFAGIACEGDLRRAMLKGLSLDQPVHEIMVRAPAYVLHEGYTRQQLLMALAECRRPVPVVGAAGQVCDIVTEADVKMMREPGRTVIRGRAPLRISFAGGGTDFSPYIHDKGGLALSATIDRYCFGTLLPREDTSITICSYDYGISVEAERIDDLVYDGKLDLAKAVIRLMRPGLGFELYLESQAAPGSGLGSSASIATVAAALINCIQKDKLSDYELAELAFQAERLELDISGGWQDQFATTFGGFNFIEFNNEETVVHPLRLKDSLVCELESRLVLCDSGQTRDSGVILQQQVAAYRASDPTLVIALDRTKDLALEMKRALLKGRLDDFGALLNAAWLEKKRFSSSVANQRINELYSIACANGALGGKVLGAGGGGYILLYAPLRSVHRVRQALLRYGVRAVDFRFENRGVHTWEFREDHDRSKDTRGGIGWRPGQQAALADSGAAETDGSSGG